MTVLREVRPLLDADDLPSLAGPELRERLLELARLRNEIDFQLSRGVRAAELCQMAELDGLVSMTSWLKGHSPLSPRAASRVVTAGRALDQLPAVAEAFAAGDVTADQVVEIARIVTPANLAAADAQGLSLAVTDATLAMTATEAGHERTVTAVNTYLAQLDPDGPEPDPTENQALLSAPLQGPAASLRGVGGSGVLHGTPIGRTEPRSSAAHLCPEFLGMIPGRRAVAPGMPPLEKLGFLTIGTFDGDDPGPGMEALLAEIELGERLGFDSAWLRHRHLQHGVSSPVAIMAAASQRTSRIELGTAVTPLAWENPLRLAEDLATVDILSGGRVNPGISVGQPMRWDDVRQSLYPDTADVEDFSYERVSRFLGFIRGEQASTFSGTQGIEVFSDRVQPQSPGLQHRVWYGAGSTRSAQWAGEQGLNLLTSSVVKAEGTTGFAELQLAAIRAFRAAHPDGEAARVSQGLVVIPTDSATPAQRARYEAYRDSRLPRTASPQGPAGLLFAPDLVGTSDQLAEQLNGHAAFREVTEVAFALPFSFEHDDYVQILTDMATTLGPALGWQPAAG